VRADQLGEHLDTDPCADLEARIARVAPIGERELGQVEDQTAEDLGLDLGEVDRAGCVRAPELRDGLEIEGEELLQPQLDADHGRTLMARRLPQNARLVPGPVAPLGPGEPARKARRVVDPGVLVEADAVETEPRPQHQEDVALDDLGSDSRADALDGAGAHLWNLLLEPLASGSDKGREVARKRWNHENLRGWVGSRATRLQISVARRIGLDDARFEQLGSALARGLPSQGCSETLPYTPMGSGVGLQAPLVAEVVPCEIALTICKSPAMTSASLQLQATGSDCRGDSEMGKVARKKPFWKTNAFWFVGMPTSLVAVAFLLAFAARALGQ
jgi:hypothetical protein